MLTVTPERPTTVRYQRRGSSLTRQRILTASIHLFSRNGFPCTTIRDIARQAGITDAAIYYHFATKKDLLQEILTTNLQTDDRIAQPPLCPGIRELVHEAVREMTRVIEDNHELLRIILREGLAGDPLAVRRYGRLLDDWESRLGGRLHSFEKAGAMAHGEATSLARQIIYTIMMAFEDMLLLRPDKSMPPAERRLKALVFLSRQIDWLLSSTAIRQPRQVEWLRQSMCPAKPHIDTQTYPTDNLCEGAHNLPPER